MKPKLLVAGDSFAEFPRRVFAFDSLESVPDKKADNDCLHWCELWAESMGGTAHSAGCGGASNTQATNAAIRSLAHDEYSHCVYFLTDPNRTIKRCTRHQKHGDLTWDKYDYVERRTIISDRWRNSEYQQAITLPDGEAIERVNWNSGLELGDGNRERLRPEWIKYAMNLAPTFMPIQETIANLALLNSACNARGVKLLVTSGFGWPQAVESWHATECYPQFTKFDINYLPGKPPSGNMRSHYDAKGHARIFELLCNQGLDDWLT